jgi:transcriptional regulator with PAS, ATPase and Fis domain
MSTSEPSSRWSRLLHHSDDPLFVLNARRRLLYANPAWERWAEVSLGDVRGQTCRSSAAPPVDRHTALLGLLAPTKEALAGRASHIRRRGLAAMATWVDIHFFPVAKDGGVSIIVGRIAPALTAAASKGPPLPEKIVQLRERAAREHRLELWDSDVPAVQRAVAQARLASHSNVSVLLQGPPGSGREWLARAIHQLGPRREEFFACLDAERLPPQLLADLMLQSTSRLNLGAVLVRHPDRLRPDLQERLAELLAEGRFGPRLFVSVADGAEAERLAPQLTAQVGTLTIRVPALGDRRRDWPQLVAELLHRAGVAAKKPHLALSPEADQALRLGEWPGQIRQVAETLRTAALHAAGESIELADLPFAFRGEPPPLEPKLPLDELLANAERRLIQLALEQARQNKSKAASLLGIWRARLLRRMEQLGIADTEPPQGAADA